MPKSTSTNSNTNPTPKNTPKHVKPNVPKPKNKKHAKVSMHTIYDSKTNTSILIPDNDPGTFIPEMVVGPGTYVFDHTKSNVNIGKLTLGKGSCSYHRF